MIEAHPFRCAHLALVASAALLLSTLAYPVAAQFPLGEAAKAEAPPQQPPDPLGRTTPLSSIAGFVTAVEREDFVAAARHMQMTPAQREQSETLARDLKVLMDRYLS